MPTDSQPALPPRRFVFCAGMARAGSTWQYQAASTLVENAGTGRRIGGIAKYRRAAFGELCDSLEGEHGDVVLKSHNVHPGMVTEVTDGGAVVLTSHRDIRDAAASWLRMRNAPFSRLWKRIRPRMWTTEFDEWAAFPSAVVMRYDEILTDPAGQLTRLADALDLQPTPDETSVILDDLSLARQRDRSERLIEERERQGRRVTRDPTTMLHDNHVGTGEIGVYRAVLRPSQIAVIEDVCGDWMQRWGYVPDRPKLNLAEAIRARRLLRDFERSDGASPWR